MHATGLGRGPCAGARKLPPAGRKGRVLIAACPVRRRGSRSRLCWRGCDPAPSAQGFLRRWSPNILRGDLSSAPCKRAVVGDPQ